MEERKRMIFSILLATLLYVGDGCQIDDHMVWTIPMQQTIDDVFDGVVLSKSTTDIEGINTVTYGQAIIGGPYFDLTIEDSQFVIRTIAAFRNYEEIEVATRVSMTIEFRCTDGGTRGGLVVWIDINDTNNNVPRFIPDEFEFVVTPPLPPGFLLTGCLNDITVRDIDLTTLRIDFSIEDNPYFEIEYDEASSTVPKEFKAQLRTTTFIRSLSEPITLTITATDVDQTNDPPQSNTTTVRIVADTEFQFPEEPVFSQTFYLANYTEDHQLNLFETISLQKGFDENVDFNLEGEYATFFTLSPNGNQVTIVVATPLSNEVWSERQIFLVVKASREFTSGDSATVIVQLPEEAALQFERVYYEGTIINNGLQISPLILSQGYEGVTVSAEVVGEYSTYFTATVQGDLVTLTMTPLMDGIIDNNSFISLQVVARSDRSVASTVVNLEIIKDDNVTPVFDKLIYNGNYDPVTGLTAEQIIFVQGFDETVTVNLAGEYANYFQTDQNGSIITLTSSTIPPELFSLQNILISIEASKPRTVGANAAIHIALPAARVLEFGESTYRGTIEGNMISLQTISLQRGYEEGVTFSLSGEYATHFTARNLENQVDIVLLTDLPETVMIQNSVIMLTLTASGLNAITTSTSILLDIIKDDTTTPVFSRNIYYGTYSGAAFDIDAINLAQGFDSGVSFRLDGAHAQYFTINNDGNNVVITLRSPSIPEDVIFNEKILLFNVLADKALTVGANAAVLIRFPTELTDSAVMRFSQNTYVGTLEENEIYVENIVLDTGFATGTEFQISGDYADHFALSNTDNVVEISSLRTLPNEVVEDNDFIVLEIEARRQRAVSVWTSVVIDIVKQEVIAPVFGQAYYTGVYTEENGLTFEETINLSEGYDETVTFALNGELATWFSLHQEDSFVTLMLNNSVPVEVLENNNQLLFTIVAHKPTSISGRAVISIDLPKDFTDSAFRFQQDFYTGYFEDGSLALGEIILGDYTSDVNYKFTGDYADYFQLTNRDGTFTLHYETPIPTNILKETNVFVFTLEAQNMNIRTQTVIILENIRTHLDEQGLEFEETFYIGVYSESVLLQFNSEIRLTTGMDQFIEFALEGEDAEWFGLTRNEGSVLVTLTSPIPVDVLANNHQLVFVVTAQSPNSATARATVVISLIKEFEEGPTILGFDRVNYLGSIENNQATIQTITLRQGYTQGVQFTLHGELADYFSLSPQGDVVTVALQSAIPEELIPANRIILLKIQAAAPQTITAYATIVIEYVVDGTISPNVELIFAQTFYSGSYASATGLSFSTPISLSQGYASNVAFVLEGDNAQWFGLEQNENSVTVTLTSPIPAAVLANNQQLVFVVTAQSPGSATARATVVISLIDAFPEGSTILGFDRVSYLGSIENNQATVPTITLIEGFSQGVYFTLHGELANYFSLSPQGAVITVALQSAIPEELIPANRIILLKIQAAAPQTITAYATIVIEYVVDGTISPNVELIFAQTFYSGSYASATGLSFSTPISLSQGYASNVAFVLEGDNAQWFGLEQNENSVTVTLTSPIPTAVLANNQQLVFVVTAQSPGSATARATVVISLIDAFPEGSTILGFDRVSYLGSIENNQATVPTITLIEGFSQGVYFTLHGELANYFSLSPQGAVITVALQSAIPEELIPANRIILLKIQAAAPQTITAYATIVIEYVVDGTISPNVELIFAQTFYSGSYASATGLSFSTPISLSQGYASNVAFVLEGDNAQWFGLEQNENSVTVTLTSPIPAAVLANNQQLVFVVTAQSPGSATARATVVISLIDAFPEGSTILGFDRVSYLGSIENNQATVPTITLIEGFSQGVYFTLHGELANYFSLSPQGAVITVALQSAIPEELIPANRIILLKIQAAAPQTITAYATIVIEYVVDGTISPNVELIFAQTFYSGSYASATGLSFSTPISLSQGYASNVAFVLEGDNAQWFGLEQNENSVTVTLTSPIPAAVLANNQQLVFVVTAQSPGSATARAVVVISLYDDSQPDSDVTFEKVLFEGIIQNGAVSHETIIITGFSGSNVELHGEYESLFVADLSNNVVTVTASGPLTLPTDATHVVLELRAGTASAVLLLNVVQTGVPALPTVTFSSSSYAVSVETTQRGLVGQVQASADNGEAVIYSLLLNNVHLQERLRINNDGELHLSAPVNTGVYTFNVVATTVFTQTQGTSTVHLSAETATACGDEFVIDPLIVLDVDEEEPHYDLINGTQYDNCHYTLTNRWPLDQTWVYVDEGGLHTTEIDREHESIAFMPVSQVQVEIILHCQCDSTRVRRSLTSDALGPYDYGTNKWILTDTILFDSRRSLVNVIVNDINDNEPIFVGKENEPIAVGYPVPELEERVLPRSLAELQATDADIGKNAALVYWSSAPELAVAPTTGFVHLRNGAVLENGARLTVNATDRNGNDDGLTGSIDILVRLLDESNIAVVTIRDAFLDDEQTVLSYLTEAVGYEIKVLRSVVISDEIETGDETARMKRDVTSAAGASLQLYVYGLVAREPVSVDQLTTDISTIVIGPVIVASTISLQDHLEGQEICVIAGRDTGLLVATIVLSVLLFIILVLIAVWFFLRWRKNRNYDEFSNDNSLASRNESVDNFSKPEALPKPRLDIAELKKSERRLQERLDAPIQEISVEPTALRNDAILDMPIPEPITPIVIQSIDKLKDAADESSEDEFGESKTRKRKSMVTFNENVEKIIHVEDIADAEDLSAEPGYEVYKL